MQGFDNLQLRMKYLLKILLSGLIVGCAGNSDEPTSTAETPSSEPITVDTNTVVSPAPAEATPTDSVNNQLGWWDSLISDDRNVRMNAINKYKELRAKSKGAADFEDAEMVRGFLKTFFSSHPDDFLAAYSGMTSEERKTSREDLAHGFYSAGSDYKSYLDEYFSNIQSSCDSCPDEHKVLLKDMRQKIESDVKKEVEKK